MAKDYLCKSCIHNNNGWCSKYKMQGLKSISVCDDFDDGIKLNPLKSSKKIINTKKISKDERLIGKREMLWTIQKQILAIDKSEYTDYESKYKSLVGCIISLGIAQEQIEKLSGLDNAIDSIIDSAMMEDSRQITKELKDEYTI